MISCAEGIPLLLASIIVIAGSLLIGLGCCMGRIPKLFAACHDITAPFIPGIMCRSSYTASDNDLRQKIGLARETNTVRSCS